MDSMVCRAMSATLMLAWVVISPATTAMPVVTRVSHATRPAGSRDRMASSTASEIWSATLSGWPSVTDSEVKTWRLLPAMETLRAERRWWTDPAVGRRGRPERRCKLARPPPSRQRRLRLEQTDVEELADHAPERFGDLLGLRRGEGFGGGRLGRLLGHGANDPLHQRQRGRRHTEPVVAQADQQHRAERFRRHLAAHAYRQIGRPPDLDHAM